MILIKLIENNWVESIELKFAVTRIYNMTNKHVFKMSNQYGWIGSNA